MDFKLSGTYLSARHLFTPLGNFQSTHMSKFGTRDAKPTQVIESTSVTLRRECREALHNVLNAHIIPHLLERLPAEQKPGALALRRVFEPHEAEVAAFAEFCIQVDFDDAMTYLQRLQKLGVDSDDLLLKLLAPAARCLGAWWEIDRVDFTQVTLGLLRIQQLTHQLGDEYPHQDGIPCAGAPRRVMLACAPGSQHLLGLAMVSEFFCKQGWQVTVAVADTESALLQAAGKEWYDLIGLSVGLVEQRTILPELLANMRKASRNPDALLLLGGPAFFHDQPSARSLGADGIAVDAAQAVALADALVNALRAAG